MEFWKLFDILVHPSGQGILGQYVHLLKLGQYVAGTICPYLIFVIFFTQAKILDRKFYTEERVNYGKRISRKNSVNCDLLAQANYTNYTLCVKLHTECKSWVSFV